ncbi:hypothetical protein CBL_07182 [Carabus blaptoides fortunei]
MKYTAFWNWIFFLFIFAVYTTAIQNMTMADNDITCTSDAICPEYLGERSFCSEGICQCIRHHHTNNSGICIKDRGLMETCESNDQCYWGPEMVDKMECSLGVCACKYGYVKHTGRICVRYFGNSGLRNNSNIIIITVISILLTAAFY